MAELALPTNQIAQFTSLLARKRWAVILPGLGGLSIGLLVLGFVPKRYESWTKVEVKEIAFVEDSQGRSLEVAPYKKDIQNVAAQILASGRLGKTLADRLKWLDYLAIRRIPEKEQEYINKIRERTRVDRAKKEKDAGSDYVTISYRDEDPQRAALFCTTLRDVWEEDSIASYKEQVQRDQVEARKLWERANDTLQNRRQAVRQWQDQHKISPTQSTNRKQTADEDWIVTDYVKTLSEKSDLEKEVAGAEQSMRLAEDRYAGEPQLIEEPIEDAVAAAASDPLGKSIVDRIVAAKAQIAQAKLDQKGKKHAHPLYWVCQQRIDEGEKEVKELTASLTPSGSGGPSLAGLGATKRTVPNPRKMETKQEAEQARATYLTAKSKLDRVVRTLKEKEEPYRQRADIFAKYNQLQTDEDVAERDYKDKDDSLRRKLNLLQRIASPAGNPYTLIDEAAPADKPVEPNVGLFLIIALVGGAGAGLGVIVLREFLRPSFRNVEDAASALPIPVLGSVHRIVTLRELRSERTRRMAQISSSLAAILLVGAIGSLYLFAPSSLPSPIRSTFDAVKQSFR